jgi:hypothetical protein
LDRVAALNGAIVVQVADHAGVIYLDSSLANRPSLHEAHAKSFSLPKTKTPPQSSFRPVQTAYDRVFRSSPSCIELCFYLKGTVSTMPGDMRKVTNSALAIMEGICDWGHRQVLLSFSFVYR